MTLSDAPWVCFFFSLLPSVVQVEYILWFNFQVRWFFLYSHHSAVGPFQWVLKILFIAGFISKASIWFFPVVCFFPLFRMSSLDSSKLLNTYWNIFRMAYLTFLSIIPTFVSYWYLLIFFFICFDSFTGLGINYFLLRDCLVSHNTLDFTYLVYLARQQFKKYGDWKFQANKPKLYVFLKSCAAVCTKPLLSYSSGKESCNVRPDLQEG